MTPSDVLTFTPSQSVITPSRPTAFKANMSYKTAKLSWNAPCYTGDEAVSYQVSKDGANWIDVTSVSGDTATYTFEGLTTNREYESACVPSILPVSVKVLPSPPLRPPISTRPPIMMSSAAMSS